MLCCWHHSSWGPVQQGSRRLGYVWARQLMQDMVTSALSTHLPVPGGTALGLTPVSVRPPRPAWDSPLPGPPHAVLQEPGQKIVDTDTASQMLQLVLPDGQFVDEFCAFLTHQKDYKKINSDQWNR